MSPIASIRSVLTRWKDFKGRSRRSEFWWWQVLAWLVLVVFYFLALGPISSETEGVAEDDLLQSISGSSAIFLGFFGVFLIAYVLVFFVPTIAVSARRFHDIGLPAWPAIIVVLFPGLWIVLAVVALIPGQRRDNRFGPDPRARDDAAAGADA